MISYDKNVTGKLSRPIGASCHTCKTIYEYILTTNGPICSKYSRGIYDVLSDIPSKFGEVPLNLSVAILHQNQQCSNALHVRDNPLYAAACRLGQDA